MSVRSTMTLRLIGIALLSFVVYPLSYAPLDRLLNGRYYESPLDSRTRMALYRPVMMLIDRTPVSGLLLGWSRLWGMENRHRLDRNVRVYGSIWPGHLMDVF